MTKQNVSADQRQRGTGCPTCGRSHSGSHQISVQARLASIQAKQERAQENAAALAEEIEWFLAAGESPHKIMGVLGYTKPDSLARRLYRQGRTDLAAIYWTVAWHERVVS